MPTPSRGACHPAARNKAAFFSPAAWYNVQTHFLGESQMTPEEQAQLGLNGFFAYKGFSVRPGPATMKRIGNKSRATIQYWTARPDRGTQATDAGTVGAIKAWIDKQTKK